MSNPQQIMTIQEMIEEAFGHHDNNRVNFKLIEIVLTLLGKQLNVLNRRVSVHKPKQSEGIRNSESKLSVSELKIHAVVKNKSKTRSVTGVDGHGNKKKTDSASASKDALKRSSFSSSSIKVTSSVTKARSLSATDQGADGFTGADIHVERKSSVSEIPQSKKYFEDLLDKIEMQREKVLRVIHQRADSHDEGVISPTAMASLEATEMQFEKLLVVERVTIEEAEEIIKNKSQPRKLSIVTQDEFLKLAQAVADLQILYGKDTPENKQITRGFTKETEFSDPMSAIQISARLDATEKAIQSMSQMLSNLANNPKSNKITFLSSPENTQNATQTQKGGPSREDAQAQSQSAAKLGFGKAERTKSDWMNWIDPNEQNAEDDSQSKWDPQSIADLLSRECTLFGKKSEAQSTWSVVGLINAKEMINAMEDTYDDIQSVYGAALNRVQAMATNAIKIAKKAEEKVEDATKLIPDINNIQSTIQQFAEQVNALDAGISTQLANIQEQITQMEYDLESGLENMQDALATRGGDTETTAELHAHFSSLLGEFENTKTYQKELEELLSEMSLDLLRLRHEVEMLRDTKSDRDEVVDALRDKAGLQDINGLVTVKQFGAVVGHVEQKIQKFRDTMYGTEIVWQKLIDELNVRLRAKAEWLHVVMLRDDINAHLEKLRKRIHVIADVLGEPNAAAVSRRLQRGTACLACAAPAVMESVNNVLPSLPAFKPKDNEVTGSRDSTSKPDGAGDQDYVCYCGRPIPQHNKDFRSEVCKRFCGGEHTRGPFVPSRVPPELSVKPMPRKTDIAVGSDGKSYRVDEPQIWQPCIPCNKKKDKNMDEPLEADEAPSVVYNPPKMSDATAALGSITALGSMYSQPAYEKITTDNIPVTPKRSFESQRGGSRAQSRRTTFHITSLSQTPSMNPLNNRQLFTPDDEVMLIEEDDIDHDAMLAALRGDEVEMVANEYPGEYTPVDENDQEAHEDTASIGDGNKK